MVVIRATPRGRSIVLTHDDGTLTTLPRVARGYQGGDLTPDPDPEPNPGGPKFAWPFDLKYVNPGVGEFGPRWGRLHAGMDFGQGPPNQPGTAIPASAAGRVIVANKTNSHGGYGNAVVIDHGGGLHTLYGHMLRRADGSADVVVNVGDEVKQGQRLGGTGNSGASQGVHLHFETHEGGYRWDQSARDPRLFFRKYN